MDNNIPEGAAQATATAANEAPQSAYPIFKLEGLTEAQMQVPASTPIDLLRGIATLVSMSHEMWSNRITNPMEDVNAAEAYEIARMLQNATTQLIQFGFFRRELSVLALRAREVMASATTESQNSTQH